MEAQDRRNFRRLFSHQARRPDADLELDKAALYLAGEEYPSLDVEGYLRLLDDLAAQIRVVAEPQRDQQDLIDALGHHLFDELGFAGDTDNYYSLENNLLNRVLDRRKGIPVTLSLIYLELGKRLGIRCHGVGLPGHFLVGLDELDLYLDPFNNGQLVSAADCRKLVREIKGPHWGWREEYLSPYNNKDILYRILNNLKSMLLRAGDYHRAVEFLKKMALVSPASPHLNRDLSWCFANMHQHQLALRHLENYLQSIWPSQETSEMEHQIKSLWSAFTQLSRQSG